MKKNLIALAVAAATSAPVIAQAAAPEVSGFADIIFTLVDDTADTGTINTAESQFTADGEIDFKGNLAEDVSVRVDIDINTIAGTFDSGEIEQAFFGWNINKDVTLMGGVFNNPVGWEAEDAPNMYQTSHSLNYGILDGQTALRGNNVAGVAIAGKAGGITLTAALLNDLAQTPEENSLAFVAGFAPTKDLALEVGVVTQDGGAETVIDLNATYQMGDLTAAGELLLASEIIDFSVMAMVNMAIPDTAMSATVRGEMVSFAADIDEAIALTLAGLYTVNDALGIVAELKYMDGEGVDGDIQIVAEFVASF